MSYINDLIQNNIIFFGIVIVVVVFSMLVLINTWSNNIKTRTEEGKKETIIESILFWKVPWISENFPFTRVTQAGGVVFVALFGVLALILAFLGKLN